MTNRIVKMTREQFKDRLRFDLRENIKLFKSVCEEILNEKCKWKLYKNPDCNVYLMASCDKNHIFRPDINWKFCPYCGKKIEGVIE